MILLDGILAFVLWLVDLTAWLEIKKENIKAKRLLANLLHCSILGTFQKIRVRLDVSGTTTKEEEEESEIITRINPAMKRHFELEM